MVEVVIVIITLSIFFLIIWIKRSIEKRNKKYEEELSQLLEESLLDVEYQTGHPDLDSLHCYNIKVQDNLICFFRLNSELAATIDGQSITKIEVWNKSIYNERVTIGRILLLGIWASFYPREKIAICHLVITWQDGQFTHHTIFEYRGYEPLQRANNARNTLIRELRNFSSVQ